MNAPVGRCLALALVLFGGACAPPPAPAPEPPPTTLPALRRRIRFEKSGTLPELVEQLRAQSGANLVIDARHLQVREEMQENPRADLVLRDVPGISVLRWILALTAPELDVVERDGVAFIADRLKLHPPILRIHDARGLKRLPPDGDGGSLSIGTPDMIGLTLTLNETPESSVGEEVLIDLIKENVRPGSWEGTQTIERTEDRRLLVCAADDIQEEVAWFLDSLRSLAPSSISVSAELHDADAAALPLLASGAPRLLPPSEAEDVSRRLRSTKTGRFDLSGLDGCRVSSRRTQQISRLFAYQANGDPLLGTWMSDASIFDVRSTLIADGGQILVELRLSLGQSRELPPAKAPSGPLPRQERSVIRLSTSFLVPNGGAVLFSLPARDSSRLHPQLCLLRAACEDPRARRPWTPALRSPPAPPRELFDRLENAPAADADFKDAPLSQVVAWLRKTTGLNWLLDPAFERQTVTFRCSDVPVARILPFLLKPHELDYRVRDDVFFITSRAAFRRDSVTCLARVSDAIGNFHDFGLPGREAKQAYTGEDLANLIKNSIHKDRWEEADGHSIQFDDGVLFLRNGADVVKECLDFVRDERIRPRRVIAFRADLLNVAADALPDASALLDAEKADALAAAATGPSRELLTWQAQEGQFSSVTWDRALDYLEDVEGKGAKLASQHTASSMELWAAPEQDGGGMALRLRAQDQRVAELRETPVPGGSIQSPLLESHDAVTSITIPAGKAAALRWPLPAQPGEAARTRVLLIRAELVRPIP